MLSYGLLLVGFKRNREHQLSSGSTVAQVHHEVYLWSRFLATLIDEQLRYYCRRDS